MYFVNPDNPSVFCFGSDDEAFAGLSLLSDGCVLLSHGTAFLLLPEFSAFRHPVQNAGAVPAVPAQSGYQGLTSAVHGAG